MYATQTILSITLFLASFTAVATAAPGSQIAGRSPVPVPIISASECSGMTCIAWDNVNANNDCHRHGCGSCVPHHSIANHYHCGAPPKPVKN